jgi:hypothetical protein
MERFNLRKLSELEVTKQYQIEITNRFAALENLNVSNDVSRVWENIKECIKTLAEESLVLYEPKQYKTWFDEECSRFLDQRKQDKMQLLLDRNQIDVHVHNLNNVRCEASRHLREKKEEGISES